LIEEIPGFNEKKCRRQNISVEKWPAFCHQKYFKTAKDEISNI